MKYKLKFEITFPGMESHEIREAKLNLLNIEMTSEMESDYPIPVPSNQSIIILGEIEYLMVDVKYKLEKDYYTTICYVVDCNYLLEKKREQDELLSMKSSTQSKLLKKIKQ